MSFAAWWLALLSAVTAEQTNTLHSEDVKQWPGNSKLGSVSLMELLESDTELAAFGFGKSLESKPADVGDILKKITSLDWFQEVAPETFWVLAIGIYVMTAALVMFVWMKFCQDPNRGTLEGSTMSTKSATVSKAWQLQWMEKSSSTIIKSASIFFLAFTAGLIVFQIIGATTRPSCLPEFSGWALAVKFGVLVILLGSSLVYLWFPIDHLYWLVIFLYFMFIPAQAFFPFNYQCKDLYACLLTDEAHRVADLLAQVDCGIQGSTTTQAFITWILGLPWVIPQLKMMHFVWIWLLAVYVGWSFLWRAYSLYSHWYSYLDLALRTVLLSVALIIATGKKFYLEKSCRNRFFCDLKCRESSERIFGILKYMLPVHVVLPMIKNPGSMIADQVSEVSILFIVIADFDQFTRKLSPAKLLEFLNVQFTAMDEIMIQFGVTKIETVGEEYVAAVGVTPEDVQENNAQGHGTLLLKAFQAVSEILKLQNGEVRFKMGLHTGPIVAGVVGQKLPRYRLVGDTINTAARQMQKGQVGSLQFGEATFDKLPGLLKDQVSYRGEVEMKGKGKVKAWSFGENMATGQSKDLQATSATAATPTPAFAKTPALVPMKKGKMNIMAAMLKGPKLKRYQSTIMELPDSDGESDEEGEEESELTTRETQCADVFEEIVEQGKDDAELTKLSRLWGVEGGFTPAMEAVWVKEFHASTTCKKLNKRVGKTAICLLVLSMLEAPYTYMVRPEMEGEALTQLHKDFHNYVALRALAVFILMCWWYLARGASEDKIISKPFPIQFLLLLSYATVALLVYGSYHYMIPNVDLDDLKQNFEQTHRPTPVPAAQIFSLNFVLVYCLLVQQCKVRLHYAVLFVVLAIVMMCVNLLQYTMPSRMLFVTIAVMNMAIAYEDEWCSRSRYKANQAVEQTQRRIGHILDTLMPPLVVTELRALPAYATPPSHKYRHATIAQSDLCGFTMLSSTKSPPQVVEFISQLFGMFDVLTDKFEVYKVETVGDAYIAGMADQPLTLKNSPINVILFGMAMVEKVGEWSRKNGFNVNCRVGVNHGECIGGIVGADMQRYHLFGDLLTGLEVLESTAPEGGVQVSKACKEEIDRQIAEDGEVKGFPGFQLRTEPHLKTSKGEIHEYEEIGGTSYVVKGMGVASKA